MARALVQFLSPPRAVTPRGRLKGARTGGTTGQLALWSVRSGVSWLPVELRTAGHASANQEKQPVAPICPLGKFPPWVPTRTASVVGDVPVVKSP